MRDHLGIFGVDEQVLLDGVRIAGQLAPSALPDKVRTILLQAGLLNETGLTEPGRELYSIAWVLREREQAGKKLGEAMRRLLPLQVIEQELRGFGPVPEEGVLDLLRLHRAVAPGLTVEQARPTFRWLNAAEVLVYSQKHKTVRVRAPKIEAAAAGETDVLPAMVSPRTPYSNVVRLRRVLRQLRGLVTWADPHFGPRALEELVTELDPSQVSEVHILSGDADNVVTGKSLRDFRRFQQELRLKGIESEWRVDNRRDWHDRWLTSEAGTWNMPPVNNLFQNQYSEILPTKATPPISEWWDRATAR